MIRKLIGITAIYLSVSLCGLAQTERIVILHTNDTHSQMEPFAATHKNIRRFGRSDAAYGYYRQYPQCRT